jgi:bleomycin hydrolase
MTDLLDAPDLPAVGGAAATTPSSAVGLPDSEIGSLRAAYAENPVARIATNALAKHSLRDVALDRALVTSIDHTFSVTVDDEWMTTHQHETGRCWIFAALNLFRSRARTVLGVKDLQLSQSFVSFWDKLERANWFLTTLAETALEYPDGDRTLDLLLAEPLADAGQWDMLVNIVAKHGLVPSTVMPDTCGAADTRQLNGVLSSVLRHGGMRLRGLVQSGAAAAEVDAVRADVLATVHRVLTGVLGNPPETFDWQWRDTDDGFHRDGSITPQEFARRYVGLDLTRYVSLVNDPRNPYLRTYTVDRLGNMVGGSGVRYLNVPAQVMADAAIATLRDGEPVWFGCDASQAWRTDVGILDPAVYDLGALFGWVGAPVPSTRLQRLVARDSQLTHAMLFTGVDLVGDPEASTPRRWRVEDSYGPEPGRKGFHVMTHDWFTEHLYEVVVREDRLPAEVRAALGGEPTVLPLWDPMGALAD